MMKVTVHNGQLVILTDESQELPMDDVTEEGDEDEEDA